jgi:putative ABC transport system substrate-binding protein
MLAARAQQPGSHCACHVPKEEATMKRREFIAFLGGAAAAWPIAVRAQQGDHLRRVVVVSGYAEGDGEGQARMAGFRETIAKLGWVDSRNIRIDYRWGVVDPARTAAIAAELVASTPDVIFAVGAPRVAALREKIQAIPIVFVQGGDPVRAGFVQSFARPGGNLTGFMEYEPTIAGKYLQLLKEIAPSVTRAAVLEFEDSTWRGDFAVIQAVAPSFGVTAISTIVNNDNEIERAIVALAEKPNSGLIIPPNNNTIRWRGLIAALAGRHGMPAVYSARTFVAAGGLISYDTDLADLYGRAAGYVDRILKGEKASDLPVQAPTKFRLVINLSAARALGLSVSPTMLIAADEVIE